MPKQFTDRYTVLFVAGVGALCAVLLALAFSALKPYQAANAALDRQKDIMECLGVFRQGSLRRNSPPAELSKFFTTQVRIRVVNRQGEEVSDAAPASIEPEREEKQHTPETQRLLLYVLEDQGRPVAYAFPVFGPGLWATIYGYLALEADLSTVRGIIFYAHGETPGLGDQITQPWFTQQFIGKKVREGDALRPVRVVKGKVAQVHPDPAEQPYYVDGITGATKTSEGVTGLIGLGLERYDAYFRRLRAAAAPGAAPVQGGG